MMISFSFYRKRRKTSATPKDETQESDYNQYQEIPDIKNTRPKENNQNLSSSNIYEHSCENKKNKVKLNGTAPNKCQGTVINGTERDEKNVMSVMKETEFQQNPVYSTQESYGLHCLEISQQNSEPLQTVLGKREGVTIEDSVLYESTDSKKDAKDFDITKNADPVYTVPKKKQYVTMEDNIVHESSRNKGQSGKKELEPVYSLPDKNKKGVTMEDNVLYESTDNINTDNTVMVDNDIYSKD